MKLDSEHSRSLYAITKDAEDKNRLYIFSGGKLEDLTGLVGDYLSENVEVIPFYSPAEKSQFIISDMDKGILRVFEFYNDRGRKFHMTQKFKVDVTQVDDYLKIFNLPHTTLSTDLEKNIVLINTNDMHVIDLVSAE